LIYTYYTKFAPEEAPTVYEECTTAKRGCVECKRGAGAAIAKFLAPLREKRAALEAKPGAVDEIIRDGDERARTAARATMTEVREKMHIG
jgi:tryptophanyl-tRNA synthetase